MTTQVFPPQFNVPIVYPAGHPLQDCPTSAFTSLLQQWIDEKNTTDALATGAVPNTRLINTTVPLSGGGALSSDLTLKITTANANRIIGAALAGTAGELSIGAVLDWISSTRGSVLYRGASGWSALGPGTSGNVLQSNGTGADPTWAAPSAGGAWSVAASWTWSTNVTTVTLTGLGGYSDLLVFIKGITTSSSGFRFLQASIDGGTTVFSTSGDYKSFAATGISANQGDFCGHSTAQTAGVDMWCRIQGNIANANKIYTNNSAFGYCANASMVTSVINAVKLGVTAGNITGGSITVLGR